MSNDLPPDDVRVLWQSQPTEPLKVSVEEVRKKAYRFQRTIRWRNVREVIAAVLVIVVFGWYAWISQSIVARAGHGLIIAGALYIVYRLLTKGASQQPPPDAVAAACLAFHRRELARQRDLLGSVWRWYLGPLVPGLVVLFIERALEAAARGASHLLGMGIWAAICAVIFFGIGKLNHAAAKKLDAEIRSLDTYEQ